MIDTDTLQAQKLELANRQPIVYFTDELIRWLWNEGLKWLEERIEKREREKGCSS